MNRIRKTSSLLTAGLVLFVTPLFATATSAADLRPQPLRTMTCGRVLQASDFGACPDDGKDDWRALTRAFATLSEAAADSAEPVKLKIAPGRYEITPRDAESTHCFSLSGLTWFEIDAEGAESLVKDPTKALLSITQCRYGIIRGIRLDYAELPFTQGRIRNIRIEEKTYDFVPDEGFPAPDGANFLQSKTRWGSLFREDGSMLKDAAPNLVQVYSVQRLDDGAFRISTGNNVIRELRENDRLAIIARYNGRSSYRIVDSWQISLIDLVNYAGPAGGFSSAKSMINVLDCAVEKLPGRLISQNADCVHVTPAEFGPWIEGCRFEGQQDDAINIKTELLHIEGHQTPERFVVSGTLQTGDSLRLFAPVEGDMLGWFKVTSVRRLGGSRSEITVTPGYEGALTCGKGKECHMFFNDNRANRGFVIRNNHFRNSRRYAMLIQAVDGEIAGNRMEHTSTAAIVLQNSASWPEGFVPRNVVIRDNVIDHCGFDASFRALGGLAAPVMMATNVCGSRNGAEPARWKGVEGIVFERNTVHAPISAAVFLSGVLDSRFTDNSFHTDRAEAVEVRNCAGLTIADNRIHPAREFRSAGASSTVDLTGRLQPGTDITSVLLDALNALPRRASKLTLPAGRYYITPDLLPERRLAITNHDNGVKRIAFLLEGFHDLVIEGHDTELIFRGYVLPFYVKGSQGVTVRGLSVDWETPFFIQGEVVSSDPDAGHYTLRMYEKGYEWRIEDSRLVFPLSVPAFSSLGESLLFDRETQAPVYRAKDFDLHRKTNDVRVRRNDDGTVTFFERLRRYPEPGTVLTFKGPMGGNRYAPVFHVIDSRDVRIEEVNIYHAPGMGILAERSGDVTLERVRVMLPPGSDRMVSTTADATHFCNCRGRVVIENCRFENMLDDGCNIHGTYAEVTEILAPDRVRVRLGHFQQAGFEFAGVGDEIWFLVAPSRERAATRSVCGVERQDDLHLTLTFATPLPEGLDVGDILENKTWNTEEYIVKNTIFRNHRARNLVIKTPGRVVVRNNLFSSMMAAILVKTDMSFWYESGAVDDVEIADNRFEECVSGGGKFGVITVGNSREKRFPDGIMHRNIRIEGNLIRTFDSNILDAEYVDGLVFRNNRMERTDTWAPISPERPVLLLKHNRNLTIEGNTCNGKEEFTQTIQ